MHHGIYLQFDGERHRIDFAELTGGRAITIYGQHGGRQGPDRRAARGRRASCSSRSTTSSVARPRRRRARASATAHDGERHELECDVIAGCDGFHGVCRPAIPAGVLHQSTSATYPFAWLGILAERRARRPTSSSTPTTSAASRCYSMRSPRVSRLYLQVRARRGHRRLVRRPHLGRAARAATALDGWTLDEGPIIEKGVTADAQLRRRADAARPAVPGRRRRAHRAADRRQGPEPRRRRRARARRGARRLLRERATRPGSTATPTRACGGSGGRSTSRGG